MIYSVLPDLQMRYESGPNILELLKKNSKGELLTLSEKALVKKHQEQQRQKSQSKKRKYRR